MVVRPEDLVRLRVNVFGKNTLYTLPTLGYITQDKHNICLLCIRQLISLLVTNHHYW